MSKERLEWSPDLQLAHTQLQVVREKFSFGEAEAGVPGVGQNTYLKGDSTKDKVLFKDKKVLQNPFDLGVSIKKENKFLQLVSRSHLCVISNEVLSSISDIISCPQQLVIMVIWGQGLEIVTPSIIILRVLLESMLF